MADRKITDLTALAAGSQATGDLLTIVDVSESAAADKNKKITVENLFKGIPGDVGINTSSPRALVDFGPGSGDGTLSNTLSEYQAVFEAPQGTGDISRNIAFAVTTGGITAAINAVDEGGSNATGLTFATGNAGNIARRMTIDENGLVGIGTGAPGHVLTVRQGSANQAVANFTGSTVGRGLVIETGNSGGTGDDTVIYNATQSSGSHVFEVNSSEKMRIGSNGRLAIGVTSASAGIHLKADIGDMLRLDRNNTGAVGNQIAFRHSNAGTLTETASINCLSSANAASGALRFLTKTSGGSNTEKMRIDSAGMVKIGTGSTITPDGDADDLVIDKDAADSGLSILSTTTGRIYFGDASVDDAGSIRYVHSDDSMRFETGSSERMRITSNGAVLIGSTSSVDVGSGAHAELQVETASNICANFYSTIDSVGPGGIIALGHARGSSSGAVQDDDILGEIRFAGGDGSDLETIGAKITAEVDGTPGSNDMPSRLAFFTTPDGSPTPVERLRITQAGNFLFGKTSSSTTTAGFEYRDASGDEHICMTNNRASGGEAAIFNRQASDGSLINFVQAGSVEGSISVSGTTVSYNGGHLSRWSQLEGNAERTEILRGTVLSNLDEMCEWGEEDNEQLNRMKISDVEGDPNVAGVFMCWDEDETYANDFYCSMTGDFIIRIAQGTTVARGDLLMSAGDGTAKPQDDDIVRSKTIAKVTSTTVSTTYADGSYCVPCVLMAC